MEFIEPTLKLYMALGAGGTAVIIVFVAFLFLLCKIQPQMKSVEVAARSSTKAIEQNANALTEVGKSNNNLAHALNLLEKGLTATNDNTRLIAHKLERQDERLGEIQMVLAQIDVRTAAYPRALNYKEGGP